MYDPIMQNPEVICTHTEHRVRRIKKKQQKGQTTFHKTFHSEGVKEMYSRVSNTVG